MLSLLRNFQKIIRWSGNDQTFKLLYRPYTGSEKKKVTNSLLDGILT